MILALSKESKSRFPRVSRHGLSFDSGWARRNFARMKIFVVGGAGYIGSICVELLLDEGHEVIVFDNLTEGHRRAVDQRAAFIGGDMARRRGNQPRAAGNPTRCGHAFRRQRARRRVDAKSLEIFSQQRLRGRQPARCHARRRMCGGSFSPPPAPLSARPSACRSMRSLAAAADQSLRRIEADVRENAALVRRNSRTEIRLASLLQRRRRDEQSSAKITLRNAPDPQRAQGRARQKAAGRDLRHRLRNAGWHLHP